MAASVAGGEPDRGTGDVVLRGGGVFSGAGGGASVVSLNVSRSSRTNVTQNFSTPAPEVSVAVDARR